MAGLAPTALRVTVVVRRRPGMPLVWFSVSGKRLFDDLCPSLFSDIELDPVTGALKTLTQGSVAFDPALVGRTATAGASVMDAEALRDKSDGPSADPLIKLRRQKEELELRAAIKKLSGESGN